MDHLSSHKNLNIQTIFKKNSTGKLKEIAQNILKYDKVQSNLRKNTQKHQELLHLWKLINAENDPKFWVDYINGIKGEDEDLSQELQDLGDLLAINYIVKKKKSQKLLIKILQSYEINQQKMAILSMMVDNLTSIMSGKVRVKSANMKKSHSHKHVKKIEFVEENQHE